MAELFDARRVSPERALILLQNRLFHDAVRGKTLFELLGELIAFVESEFPRVRASILFVDEEGRRLVPGLSPRLSAGYISALCALGIGPSSASCGSAVFIGDLVIVADIATDPLWANVSYAAAKEGVAACSSLPFRNSEGAVIGTLALHADHRCQPSGDDISMLDQLAALAGLLVVHDRQMQHTKFTGQEINHAFYGAATGIAITDLHGRFVQVNRAYCEMLGYTEQELLSLDYMAVTHVEDRHKTDDEIQLLLRGLKRNTVVDKRYTHKDGQTIWARVSVSVQHDARGRPTGLIGIAEDFTEIKLAQAQREEAEKSMLNFLANLPGMVYRCRNDDHWTMLYVSQSVQSLTGYDADDLLLNRRLSYAQVIHPDDIAHVGSRIDEAVRLNGSFHVNYRIRRADGQIAWVWEQGRVVLDDTGEVAFLEGYTTDITARKVAEAALADSQRQAEALLNAVAEGINGVDQHGNIVYVNKAALQAFGYTETEMLGKNSHALVHHHKKNAQPYAFTDCAVYKTLQDGKVRRVSDEVFFRKDGSSFPVEYMVSPVFTESDEIHGAVVSFNDISERLALEEQLRRAQRLDSLGQLTGGVAHDFNNLLTVIMGNAELLESHLSVQDPMKKVAGMVVNAAQRGAELTRALLAFSRKQPLKPSVVSVNDLLEKNRSFIKSAVGEHITLTIIENPDLWSATIDAHQLENALLNLAINARDAMRAGGQLTFHTSNVHFATEQAQQRHVAAGDYVAVSVTDTGSGIEPAILDRVFEPFFTTKDQGKGTGLGLAMVYGFVRQSGGHTEIETEPGRGTTIRLYLPAVKSAVSLPEANVQPRVKGGAERIFLVEDDPLVRLYAVTLLSGLGYDVTEYANGAEALAAVAAGKTFDLLFTDMVMPGDINGKQLADQVLALCPTAKVLFTSGYSENHLMDGEQLAQGIQLLTKPYRKDELAAKIREILDQ